MTRIGVIVPFYNCQGTPERDGISWLERALVSLGVQARLADRVVVIDDASTDESRFTDEAVAWTDRHHPGWTVIRNEANIGKALNIRRGVEELALDPDDVVVILDGDDFLEPHALATIVTVYEDPQVWLAYGQYQAWPENTGQVPASLYPDHVLANRSFRHCEIHFNHPLTFRRKLWDGIEDGDLRDDDGSYFTGGADFILMVPLMEMAGGHRIRFMEDVIYNYNAINPLADNLVNDPARQGRIVKRPMKAMMP
jgi:glycosyltransferase involved in cell wall biosynthesis